MLRNIVCIAIAALLICLFVCAADFTCETSHSLRALAEDALASANAGRWDDCQRAANALAAALNERKIGLKMLIDHEDVDALVKSAALAALAASQNDALELARELTGFCASLDYICDIDKLLWTNYL